MIPGKYLKDLSRSITTIMNPNYVSSTLSPSILALTVGCTAAMEAWKVLENRFLVISRLYVTNLKAT